MTLDDDAVKIILSTKGTMDDVSPEMKRILDYIDGKGASDKFTEELEEAKRWFCSFLRNKKLLLCKVTPPRIALAILAKQSAGFAFL